MFAEIGLYDCWHILCPEKSKSSVNFESFRIRGPLRAIDEYLMQNGRRYVQAG